LNGSGGYAFVDKAV